MSHAPETRPMPTSTPVTRMPERFLLVGPDRHWCEATEEALATLARHAQKQSPQSSFLAWRLRHGLLRVLPVAQLEATLAQVLEMPEMTGNAATLPNVTHLWTTQNATQWLEFTARSQALAMPAAREITLSLIDAHAPISNAAQAANRPDTLVRLSWLLEGRPQPIPREWLTLAPLPELNLEENTAMAKEGRACYDAWAESMASLLESFDAEELQALWGPFPDTPETQPETEEDPEHQPEGPPDKNIGKTAPTTRQGTSFGTIGPRHAATNDATPFMLAAASIKSPQTSTPKPLHTWRLEPAFSHGATHLEVWARGPANIEFIAHWEQEKTPNELAPIRLVLTLPRQKPLVLACQPPKTASQGQNDPSSLPFSWPQQYWPQPLPKDAHPLRLQNQLKEALAKAHISLM